MTRDDQHLQDGAQLTKQQLQDALGGLSLDTIGDPTAGMATEERKGYVSQIAQVFPLLEKEVLWAIKAQVEHIAREALDVPQIMFGRGGISFGDLLLGRFQLLVDEHKQNIQDARSTDAGQPEGLVPQP